MTPIGQTSLLALLLEEPEDFKQEGSLKSSSLKSSEKASTWEFVRRLSENALRHRATRHPYLKALSEGKLPDVRWALKDFARHYYGYSAHFPQYLTAVISQLERADHRAMLLENLTEETGVYEERELDLLKVSGIEPDWIKGYAHPELFRRFREALEVQEQPEADQVVIWRELFLSVLRHGSAAEAVGALGIGTENIVSSIYLSFVDAIHHLGDLDPRDTVFFPLHTAVDDAHRDSLLKIAVDLSDDQQSRIDLQRGTLKALQLRSSFWDWLYARALDPEHADLVL